MKIVLFAVLLSFCARVVEAQVFEKTDSLRGQEDMYRFKAKKLVVPAVFVGLGAMGLVDPHLKRLNQSTQYESSEHVMPGAQIDNYMQYAPAAAVYVLNGLGVKGKHNFKDRTIIYATSQLLTAAVVFPMKNILKEERPDGANSLSFPSGHTATAFSSAQFMFREYRDENFWLSVCGYPVAAATGMYRVFNNRHWLGDIVAGAGIGILTTEAAYWLFPVVSKIFPKGHDKQPYCVIPSYQPGRVGVSVMKTF